MVMRIKVPHNDGIREVMEEGFKVFSVLCFRGVTCIDANDMHGSNIINLDFDNCVLNGNGVDARNFGMWDVIFDIDGGAPPSIVTIIPGGIVESVVCNFGTM